jgi:hypothetical protein
LMGLVGCGTSTVIVRRRGMTCVVLRGISGESFQASHVVRRVWSAIHRCSRVVIEASAGNLIVTYLANLA